MRSFPLPVRVAAGLAVTAAECGRRLPSYVLGLPITVASQALQVSMRLQQQVTELAIKGDEALGGWRTAEDQPEWATFDEDQSTEQDTATEDDVPGVPADYDNLTLPQLRGRLRRFSASELVAMLDYERAHAGRPEFLRMLSNRLDKLRAAETSDL
jgi:hypothetical protein